MWFKGKRSGLSGLGMTLLSSIPVNLAELRRAQTRSRAVSGKKFANYVIEISLKYRV